MGRRAPIAAAAALLLAVGCSPAARPPSPAPAIRLDTVTSPAPDSGAAADTVNPALADLDATLWTQLSAEYRGAAIQAYRTARRQLLRALEDSSWTASLRQDRPYRGKRPAVILDVDETVLDNSPYQARLVRRGERYGSESWGRWVREARAPAVPGALSFATFAHRRGVRVFYVTNRNADLEEPTRRNLERLGFPMADTTDVLLTEGERPGWDGTKVRRREHVASGHRILLLVGDNLGDFTTDPQPGRWVRRRAPERPGGRPARRPRVGDRWWGERWIVVPNPVYGSWEDAVLEGAGDDPADVLRRKIRSTVPMSPDTAGATGPA